MLQFDPTKFPQTFDKPPLPLSKPSFGKSSNKSSGRWTKEEHQKFVEGLKKFGKNWKQVEEHVGTRNGAQIRSHAQKFFNRLEREFNLKFEDLNLQSDKIKFEETLKLISDSPEATPKTAQETPAKEMKLSDKIQPNLMPIPEVPCKFDTLVQNSMRSNTTFSLSNSPKLNYFECPPNLMKRPSRKMSEDILTHKSYSLFDVLIAKIKVNNNGFNSPKLSDLVDISSTRSSFDATPLKPQSFRPVVKNEGLSTTPSFKPNPRKMSEDNVLVNMRFGYPLRPVNNNFSQYDQIVKKVKLN